jgi:hypothetical protein
MKIVYERKQKSIVIYGSYEITQFDQKKNSLTILELLLEWRSWEEDFSKIKSIQGISKWIRLSNLENY